MARQVAVLLGESPKRIAADLQVSWEKFKDAPPFDGQHFQEVGVTTEMMRDFAERRGINLIVMHGNRKICHDTGGSEQFLAYVSWDSHAYFLRSARPFTQRPVDTRREDVQTRVQMDRDVQATSSTWEWWDGTLQAGSFITQVPLAVTRQQWLEEGIVPMANACGIAKFSSITRVVDDGLLKLKAAPQFMSEIQDVMKKLRCPYKLESIGVATLRA